MPRRFFVGCSANRLGHRGTCFPEERELLGYFEARRKFESRNFAGLDAERTIQFREQKRKFGGSRYEEICNAWSERLALPATPNQADVRLGARFAAYLAPHDYEMIRSLRHAS